MGGYTGIDLRFSVGVLPCLFCLISGLVATSAAGRLDVMKYITTVRAVCPPDVNGTAVVHVLTDSPDTQPYAVCRGDRTYDFVPVAMGRWALNGVFRADDDFEDCIFHRNDNSNTYVINVFVPFTYDLIRSKERPRVVTCTYDDYSEENSANSEFEDSKKPIKELLENMGTLSKSDVRLYVADVTGKRIEGTIRIGRTIRLRAELVGNFPEEVSFQVISCKAVGGRSHYNIIIGGCGDGRVLRSDTGFTTTGKVTVSPYFRSFRLLGSRILVIQVGNVRKPHFCIYQSSGIAAQILPSSRVVPDEISEYKRQSGKQEHRLEPLVDNGSTCT